MSVMKKLLLLILLSGLWASCRHKAKTPDVSGITVNIATERFDQDFFSLDTANPAPGLAALREKYPVLLPVFLENIVGVSNEAGIREYYRYYRPVYDSAQRIYSDFTPVSRQITEAFRYVRYYFPDYELPTRIIPVVGPMNSREDLARMNNGDYTADFIGPGFIGIGLQFYLGQDFSLYQASYFVNNVAPAYRSRRFAKEYIAPDVMKLVVDDLFPDKSSTLPLIEQMIAKGRQWWLLDKFMPNAPDSVKTGYTAEQLKWCTDNEGQIWAQINKTEDLFSNNTTTIQNYIGEAPFTQALSQEYAPGNIGPWIGRQIVRKFESAHPELTPAEVMRAPVQKILSDAKYRPR